MIDSLYASWGIVKEEIDKAEVSGDADKFLSLVSQISVVTDQQIVRLLKLKDMDGNADVLSTARSMLSIFDESDERIELIVFILSLERKHGSDEVSSSLIGELFNWSEYAEESSLLIDVYYELSLINAIRNVWMVAVSYIAKAVNLECRISQSSEEMRFANLITFMEYFKRSEHSEELEVELDSIILKSFMWRDSLNERTV